MAYLTHRARGPGVKPPRPSSLRSVGRLLMEAVVSYNK